MSEQKRKHLRNLEELMADQSDLILQIEIAFGEGLVAANAINNSLFGIVFPVNKGL